MLTQTIYQTAPGVRFFDLALGKQVLIAWATAFGGYADIELTYTLFSLVCVGSHLGSPESFPPIMGAFRRDAWSVRQMWGVCWHQMMRRPCGEAGRQVKRLLGLKTGGFASRYTQIGVAFVVSGLMHHLGAVKNRWDDGGTHQMLYFLMQPLAYIFEDLVISIGKQRGIKSSPVVKVIGYAWVFAWFSFSMRYMAAYQPLSWLEEEGLPSVVRPVLKTVSLSK
ncbi:tat pathway signal sequence [Phlyctema vagabunda]|uniref:Tat pathway signal sequence n=1 Tax=Phlyctema vagabunda TaxID=108571 RepID=A0ABR4PED7_9HELO